MLHDIKLQSQRKANLYLESKNGSIEKDYLNASLWEFYNHFDKNSNEKLDANEITQIKEMVKNIAGNDNVLDTKELKTIADKYGISVENLENSLIILSADIIADEVYNSLRPNMFKSKNTDLVSDLINNKINKENIAEIWDRYQLVSDSNNSLFGILLVSDTSLSNDILQNYSFNDAAKLMKKLVTTMSEYAKENGIKITELLKEYNSALKRQDIKAMDVAVREMGSRLCSNTRLNKFIKNHIETNDKAEISEINLVRARALAENKNVPITDDIMGDNTLGNSQTKASTKEAAVILKILNKLLSEPKFNEKIDACIKKENNCFGIYFPNNNRFFCSTENGLVDFKDLENGVIGDGDLSALVASIRKQMQIDKINTSKPVEVEKYIKTLFDPEVTGHFRPFGY